MKFTYATALTIAAIAGQAFAQDLSGLPTCAQPALLSGLSGTGCGLTDYKCVCESSAFISTVAAAIATACSADDIAKTNAFASSLCLSVGVTLPTAGPTSAAASSAATSAVVSSAEVMTTAISESVVVSAPGVSSTIAYSASVVVSAKPTTTLVYVPVATILPNATVSGGVNATISHLPIPSTPASGASTQYFGWMVTVFMAGFAVVYAL